MDNIHDSNTVNDSSLEVDDEVRAIEIAWNNEIRQYDLLTEEEEIKCGQDLKLVKDLDIVNSKKRINLELVLSNLTNNNASKILSDLLKMYSDIHEKTLSNEEELVLKYQKIYNKLGRVLNDDELKEMGINKTRCINEDALVEQVNKYARYNESKYKMYHANLRLILPTARKYSQIFLVDYMDLVQEGNIGLLKAVNGFDVDKGFRFSTYATWCICRTILRYASDNFAPVKTGSHYWEQHRDFQKRVDALVEETGKTYSSTELAEIFNMDYETVLDFVLYNPNATHLDQPIGDDEDLSLVDLIADDNINFDNDIFLEELRDAFRHYMHKLPPKMKQIISMMYGINDEKRIYTTNEIIDKLGITKGAITTLHNKALTIIRNLVRRNGKKDHLRHFK